MMMMIIPLAEKCFDWVFSHFHTVLVTSSTFENFVQSRNSLRGWQTSVNKKEPNLDCKEEVSAVLNQTAVWFPLFAALWGLSLFWWNSMTTVLRKGKVFMHNFVYCNLRSSQLFRNIFYCNYLSDKMSALTESNLSGEPIIAGQLSLSSSWILFGASSKNYPIC